MPKLRHFDNLNTARFVTFSCYRRQQLLTDWRVMRCFLAQLEHIRERHQIKVFGYVIMPEHVHLVLHPGKEIAFGRVIGELKSLTARQVFARGYLDSQMVRNRLTKTGYDGPRSKLWQPRCYDHNCRSSETVKEKVIYCHKNPVKRGLVGRPEDWIYSSFLWYTGVADVPFAIDEMD